MGSLRASKMVLYREPAMEVAKSQLPFPVIFSFALDGFVG